MRFMRLLISSSWAQISFLQCAFYFFIVSLSILIPGLIVLLLCCIVLIPWFCGSIISQSKVVIFTPNWCCNSNSSITPNPKRTWRAMFEQWSRKCIAKLNEVVYKCIWWIVHGNTGSNIGKEFSVDMVINLCCKVPTIWMKKFKWETLHSSPKIEGLPWNDTVLGDYSFISSDVHNCLMWLYVQWFCINGIVMSFHPTDFEEIWCPFSAVA